MDHMERTMLKGGRGPLLFKIRKIWKDFDGRTQAIRGSLIALARNLGTKIVYSMDEEPTKVKEIVVVNRARSQTNKIR